MESVYNIVDNAFEAITEKRKYRLSDDERDDFSGLITLKLTQQEKQVLIEISDNGVGVKPEDQPKIFAPFFTTKSSQISGTGIGMYVVKRIVEENHNGKIWFESQYMQGTTFYMVLPKGKIKQEE